jgi:hypothetical protein
MHSTPVVGVGGPARQGAMINSLNKYSKSNRVAASGSRGTMLVPGPTDNPFQARAAAFSIAARAPNSGNSGSYSVPGAGTYDLPEPLLDGSFHYTLRARPVTPPEKPGDSAPAPGYYKVDTTLTAWPGKSSLIRSPSYTFQSRVCS